MINSIQREVRRAFDYRNGVLYWQDGKEAGTLGNTGYIIITLNGIKHPRHQWVWIYHFGKRPEGRVIDHINRDRLDDRIENLRAVTKAENNKNNLKVCVTKRGERYQARRSEKQIGVFDTYEEAKEACIQAKLKEYTHDSLL